MLIILLRLRFGLIPVLLFLNSIPHVDQLFFEFRQFLVKDSNSFDIILSPNVGNHLIDTVFELLNVIFLSLQGCFGEEFSDIFDLAHSLSTLYDFGIHSDYKISGSIYAISEVGNVVGDRDYFLN